MTEWDAAAYAKRSSLQEAMADEVLALVELQGSERVLDIGCGDGRITAEIAARVPSGSVVGVDSSHDMIAFAAGHFTPAARPNLRFQVADAHNLPFGEEFDLIVSFNALHWLPDPAPALRSIRAALKPGGMAQLRLVSAGERKSLESVLEDTRQLPRWSQYFQEFRTPFFHPTPGQYATLAEASGLQVLRLQTASKAWDFKSREAFFAFGSVTFVEWAHCVPESERKAFITETLDRYQPIAASHPGEENTFKFYQMDITLARGGNGKANG